jgi:hypothetical protein
MLELKQHIEIKNSDDDVVNILSPGKITLPGNDEEGKKKNAREEFFENDLYVWKLLLLIEKKDS